MDCPRCKGVMIRQDLHDHNGTYLTVPGWRCLSCGEVLDPTILSNRRSVVMKDKVGAGLRSAARTPA
ncbi:hypothetical protein [Candidatus Nitrospira bockiana]